MVENGFFWYLVLVHLAGLGLGMYLQDQITKYSRSKSGEPGSITINLRGNFIEEQAYIDELVKKINEADHAL